MRVIDVFNGDADGICALLQLRQAHPCESELITGVKRDIDLLRQVRAGSGDRITVLDIAMEKNRADLDRLLAAGCEVLYVDHHFPGEIPQHPALHSIINTAPEVCTSLLVNGHLKGAHAAWAVVGAFGDNLAESARRVAATAGLNPETFQALENLGTYINYNGYGPSLDDLHFAPADLFRQMQVFADPLDFIVGDRNTFTKLEDGYRSDMQAAAEIMPMYATAAAAVYLLPDQPWARRVSGVFSNDLVNLHAQRAHAVLTEIDGGDLLVSVRAPLSNRTGADEICRQFATGGGRKAAAGINRLPRSDLDRFIDVFSQFYGSGG